MVESRNRLVGVEKLKTYEGIAKRFGNGAHIVLPRAWKDKKLKVQIIEE
jgi:putative transposon-encoded protein